MSQMVMRLSFNSLLGSRRVLALVALSSILLLLALLVNISGGGAEVNQLSVLLLNSIALGSLLPLLGLITGTGAIGPELDDGSIVYLVTKPIRSSTIILAKYAVALCVTGLFGLAPILLAGIVAGGEIHPFVTSYLAAGAAASLAYCALFLMLATVTRNAVVAGLVYALVWETMVGRFVPGARALSVQQWALAIGEKVAGRDAGRMDLVSAVEPSTSVASLLVLILGSLMIASMRLRRAR